MNQMRMFLGASWNQGKANDMKWIVMVRYKCDELYQPYSGKVHDSWSDALEESLWIKNNDCDDIANISVDQLKGE